MLPLRLLAQRCESEVSCTALIPVFQSLIDHKVSTGISHDLLDEESTPGPTPKLWVTSRWRSALTDNKGHFRLSVMSLLMFYNPNITQSLLQHCDSDCHVLHYNVPFLVINVCKTFLRGSTLIMFCSIRYTPGLVTTLTVFLLWLLALKSKNYLFLHCEYIVLYTSALSFTLGLSYHTVSHFSCCRGLSMYPWSLSPGTVRDWRRIPAFDTLPVLSVTTLWVTAHVLHYNIPLGLLPHCESLLMFCIVICPWSVTTLWVTAHVLHCNMPLVCYHTMSHCSCSAL